MSLASTHNSLLSSSSWGCELKYQIRWTESAGISHPLREDVSWNLFPSATPSALLSHPLREDVSWNNKSITQTVTFRSHPLREDVSWNHPSKALYSVSLSSSSWGCELKYREEAYSTGIQHVILFVRMWVEITTGFTKLIRIVVILFVRMWVEMSSVTRATELTRSSSSWGCELK